MFGRQLWQGIGTGARIILAVVAAMFVLVFAITRLHIVLDADLATPLFVITAVGAVILSEIALRDRSEE